MKSILKIAFIIFTLTLVACTSDDNTQSDEVIFSAKINGELFEATKFNQATLLKVDQSQRVDINVENEKYKLHLAIAINQLSDCMPTGEYNNENGREMLLNIYYAMGNNNFLSMHFPVEDAYGKTIEKTTVSSCSENGISGTFSGTYHYDNDINDPLPYPEDLIITEGKFQNIKLTLLNP